LALRNEVKPDQSAPWVFLLWYLCCGKASLRREKQIIVAAQNRDGDPEWRSFADCHQDALQRLDDGVKISPLRRAKTIRRASSSAHRFSFPLLPPYRPAL
jgi:hypothetical protein